MKPIWKCLKPAFSADISKGQVLLLPKRSFVYFIYLFIYFTQMQLANKYLLMSFSPQSVITSSIQHDVHFGNDVLIKAVRFQSYPFLTCHIQFRKKFPANHYLLTNINCLHYTHFKWIMSTLCSAESLLRGAGLLERKWDPWIAFTSKADLQEGRVMARLCFEIQPSWFLSFCDQSFLLNWSHWCGSCEINVCKSSRFRFPCTCSLVKREKVQTKYISSDQ